MTWVAFSYAVLGAVALVARRGAVERVAGFLGYLAAFFAGLTVAVVVAGLGPPVHLPSLPGVLADTARVAAFLSLLFALDQRPELPRPRRDPLELAGSVAFLFALLVYFVHIPNLLNPLEYLGSGTSALLALGLDVFALGLVTARAVRAESVGWRRCYGLFAGAFLLWGLGDLTRVGSLWRLPGGWVTDEPLGRFALPLVTLGAIALVAALVVLPRRSPDPAEAQGAVEMPMPSLVLYAAALPLLHLLLYPVARQIPASYGAREILTFLYVVTVGGLAAVQVQRRELARRATAARLRDSEQRYRALVDGHPDALVVEQGGRIVFQNAAFAALPAPIPTAESLAEVGVETPGAAETVRGEQRISLPRQRRSLHLDVTHQPIRWHDGAAWQVTLRDMTRLDALRRRTRRMKRLAQLGELAGSLAEELRVPLADLGERSQRLAAGLAADDLQTRDDLALAVERMERIVDGMRRFSQPPPLALEAVDPGALIHTALRQLAERLERRSVNLLLDFRHGEAAVEVDRHQMLQVLVNLLDNALDSIAGSGEVALRTRRDDAGHLELAVEDSGRGIPASELDRIFDPFFTTGDGGTGLGLAVVARILEQHGCRHEVESQPGVGTRFRILFPPPADPPDPADPLDRPESKAAARPEATS